MPTDDSKNGIIDYVSTGHLPDPDTVVKLVQEAHKRGLAPIMKVSFRGFILH